MWCHQKFFLKKAKIKEEWAAAGKLKMYSPSSKKWPVFFSSPDDEMGEGSRMSLFLIREKIKMKES